MPIFRLMNKQAPVTLAPFLGDFFVSHLGQIPDTIFPSA